LVVVIDGSFPVLGNQSKLRSYLTHMPAVRLT